MTDVLETEFISLVKYTCSYIPTSLTVFKGKQLFLNTVFEVNQENGQGPKLKVIQYG
jgi:hypothetical protein